MSATSRGGRDGPLARSHGKVRQPNERQRALAALDLYIAGNSYAEIGRRLGYRDHSGPHRAISRLLDRRETEGVDMLRRVHGARLTELLRAVWPRAVSGDLDAVKSALSILSDIAKLHGLNAPERVNVGISETEFASQAAELLAVVGPGPLRELARTPEAVRALPVVDGELVHSGTDGWSNLGPARPDVVQEAPETPGDAPAAAPGPSPRPADENDSEDEPADENDEPEPEPKLPTGTRRVPAEAVPYRGFRPGSGYDPRRGSVLDPR